MDGELSTLIRRAQVGLNTYKKALFDIECHAREISSHWRASNGETVLLLEKFQSCENDFFSSLSLLCKHRPMSKEQRTAVLGITRQLASVYPTVHKILNCLNETVYRAALFDSTGPIQ